MDGWQGALDLAARIGGLGGTTVMALAVVAMWRGWLVRPGELEARLEAAQKEMDARLEAARELLAAERRRAEEAERERQRFMDIAMGAVNLGEAAVARAPEEGR